MELLQPVEVFEQVLESDQTGFICPQRVLWVVPQDDLLVVIGIEKNLKKPVTYSLRRVMELIEKGMLRRIDVRLRPYVFAPEETILRRSLEIRDRAWEIIKPLVSDECIPDIYLPPTRGMWIARRAKELNCDPKQVYRPLYRYWAHGSCIDALIGCYDLCSCSGKTQQPNTAKRGRRPDRVKFNNNDTSLLGPSTADVRKRIEAGIVEFLKPGVTKKKAWEETKKKHFKKGAITQGSLFVPIPPEAHEAPSLFQFNKVVKDLDWDLSLTRKNISTSTWYLRHRGVLGNSRHRV